MKADLTRDTFHPLKHYARVLMQQGRVQLDADWNEQAGILLRYLQALAVDLIGPAGGPEQNYGFAVSPITNSTAPDFRIGFGHYYVDGLLCQADYIPIALFKTATLNVFQVRNWQADFEQKTAPYYEVFDDTLSPVSPPVLVQISNPKPQQNQITIQNIPAGADFSKFVSPKLRRLITYLHQPDYVSSPQTTPPSPPPLPSGFAQIYLDVWERIITYVEDDRIREIALGGPDTAARSKLVWQVKWTQPPDNGSEDPGCISIEELYDQFQPANRGWLQARAKQNSVSTDPCIISPNASYSGPENQLYRVEINRPGAAWDGSDPNDAKAATFKWSRENGSVFYPIASGGGTATVVVESLGRDDRFGLAVGDLVEVQDDRSVLLNSSGNLLTVHAIDATTMTVTLDGTPDATLGSDKTLHPLLRRWDQTEGDTAEGGLTLAADNAAFVQEGIWLALEDGVQIRFQSANTVTTDTTRAGQVANQYRTSDYWLIPARTATGDVEWPKDVDPQGNPETDAQGNFIPVALLPHGVTHHYAPLAVVSTGATGIGAEPEDCRQSFNTVVALSNG
jgi:Family of unknown function (DUF6519)